MTLKKRPAALAVRENTCGFREKEQHNRQYMQ